ncbi:Uncharacterised protein [Fusobacterium necrophorum subsp. necrophorum]|nr:Uncharacterised protein [Fusobacterium necrophorum subsp. necrophorum]
MLTDNSVVVLTYLSTYYRLHSPVIEASEMVRRKSALRFCFRLTTMLVFIPILFIPGFAREILEIWPMQLSLQRGCLDCSSDTDSHVGK